MSGLRAAALLLGLALVGCSAAPRWGPDDAPRPHIVVLLADDLGHGDLERLAQVRAPQLRRLAAEGLRLEQAFLTSSSSSPSRASLSTGLYPHETGAADRGAPLPADAWTLASGLRRAGYYTAQLGKWHLGDASAAHFEHRARRGGLRRLSRDWPRDRPLFLWVGLRQPHRPFSEGDARLEPLVRVPRSLPDDDAVRKDLVGYLRQVGALDGAAGRVLSWLEAEGIAQDTLVVFLSDNGAPFPRAKGTLYDAGIHTPLVLRWPGQIAAGGVSRELVSALDLAPTLLEVAGATPRRGLRGLSWTPLFADPAAPWAGTRRDAIFAERHFHDFPLHARALRTRRFKYIRNHYPELPATPPADVVRSPSYQSILERRRAGQPIAPELAPLFEAPRSAEELYDLELDPEELDDLAGDPAYADELRRLRRELEAWQRETRDAAPGPPGRDRYDRETGRKLRGATAVESGGN